MHGHARCDCDALPHANVHSDDDADATAVELAGADGGAIDARWWGAVERWLGRAWVPWANRATYSQSSE